MMERLANAVLIATKRTSFGTTSTGGLAFVQVGSAGTKAIQTVYMTIRLLLHDFSDFA